MGVISWFINQQTYLPDISWFINHEITPMNTSSLYLPFLATETRQLNAIERGALSCYRMSRFFELDIFRVWDPGNPSVSIAMGLSQAIAGGFLGGKIPTQKYGWWLGVAPCTETIRFFSSSPTVTYEWNGASQLIFGSINMHQPSFINSIPSYPFFLLEPSIDKVEPSRVDVVAKAESTHLSGRVLMFWSGSYWGNTILTTFYSWLWWGIMTIWLDCHYGYYNFDNYDTIRCIPMAISGDITGTASGAINE